MVSLAVTKPVGNYVFRLARIAFHTTQQLPMQFNALVIFPKYWFKFICYILLQLHTLLVSTTTSAKKFRASRIRCQIGRLEKGRGGGGGEVRES